ncbi:DUF1963 domain-containing protein [Streptomyces finlayi]|uniref:DUF1963 domain-containing protein n=1 Tax=Streptomyces finlayi TaxID=67296 RepID=A0A7G7BQY5_9ACTN|nr:hypothetical protein [Streptomyces finlayi]QNE77750.1 DUF1963 domain-containing protein [Streptomyces finlayi]
MTVPVPLAFTPAEHRVGTPVTKLGGQPVWLEQPAWPLSRSSGEPMQFLGQLAVDRLPFWINFGDGGVGYAFLSPDGLEGRFLWQSPGDEEAW